jgi:hypothetical protein
MSGNDLAHSHRGIAGFNTVEGQSVPGSHFRASVPASTSHLGLRHACGLLPASLPDQT